MRLNAGVDAKYKCFHANINVSSIKCIFTASVSRTTILSVLDDIASFFFNVTSDYTDFKIATLVELPW